MSSMLPLQRLDKGAGSSCSLTDIRPTARAPFMAAERCLGTRRVSSAPWRNAGEGRRIHAVVYQADGSLWQ